MIIRYPRTDFSNLFRNDAAGRSCLNDLHWAAGGKNQDHSAFFLRRKETKALIDELLPRNSANLQSIPVVTQGGRAGGTFVLKELVYAYAMWISAKFHIQVIRAYDALVTARQAPVAAPKELLTRDTGVAGHGPLRKIKAPRAERLVGWLVALGYKALIGMR